MESDMVPPQALNLHHTNCNTVHVSYSLDVKQKTRNIFCSGISSQLSVHHGPHLLNSTVGVRHTKMERNVPCKYLNL
jgi:hypothetical protein